MGTESQHSIHEHEPSQVHRSAVTRDLRERAVAPGWEEPDFEVIEAGAEVTAYVYRR